MQEIHLYEDIVFTLPAVSRETWIPNCREPKKKQKWERPEMHPEIVEKTKDEIDELYTTNQEVRDYIDEENRRCIEGYWFYINGQKTYITGDHYFYLTWFKLDVGYPEYRDVDRRWFYAWQVCVDDPKCLGLDYLKKRRDGFSYRAASCILNMARKTFNAHFGMVSKTGNDAKELFDKVVYAYMELPPFFKPQVQSAEDVKKELIFKAPIQKVTHKTKNVKREISLNTRISWKNTGENTYDGNKLIGLIADECFDPSTKILCENYVFKPIKDINVGDKVIVEGGKSIEVAKKFIGKDEMYLVEQPYAKDYIVSSKHRLCLEIRDGKDRVKSKTITPTEYFNLSRVDLKHTHGLRSSGIEIEEKDLPIDPYILGVWLGDGRADQPTIVCNYESDKELYEYIKTWAKENRYNISETKSKNSEKVRYIRFKMEVFNTTKGNPFLNTLKELNIFKNKHIPEIYLKNSTENRLKLLAGIIDTDGSLANKSSYEIGMSNKELIEGIYWLAKSLGFSVSNIKEKTSNFNTKIYRLSISGDLKKIPIKIGRKKDLREKLYYKFRKNRISIKKLGIGDYVGIQLKTENEDDRRLILEDWTLSMNCGKWIEADFEKWMQIVEKCLTLGAGKKIVGKAVMGTTVNEPIQDGTAAKRKIGGRAFENVWYKSSSLSKTANGQTISGLYRYFVPAYDGLEGFIGEYGESIIETPTEEQKKFLLKIDPNDECIGAKEFLMNKRNAYIENGDLAGYYEECRMNPFEETEAFREGANKIHTYNITRIFNQMDFNKSFLAGNPHLVLRGNFMWRGGVKDTEVDWYPSQDGKWLITWLPEPENRNNIMLRHGKKYPGNTATGCFGLDPYDNKTTSDHRKSNAACYGTRKFDIMQPHNTGFPILEYVNRPALPEAMWEDMIMMCVYYGWELLCESNKIGTINYFRMRGYEGYLMDRPEETQTTFSSANQKEKGIPLSGDEARQSLIYAVESFVENYVGLIEREGEEPFMGKVYFDRLLKCLSQFDFEQKWTKFDEMVGFGLSLLGNRKHVAKPVQRRSYDLFEKYRVIGTESQRINY